MISSQTEGFGSSCPKAMECKLPVIVSHCGESENFAVGEIINKENPQ